MKRAYESKAFRGDSQDIILSAIQIIDNYRAQGFTLTLRQLYYQFVARDLLANDQRQYKRLGSIINDARMAGLIDWSAIEDRTRNVRSSPHWRSPGDIVRAAANGYRIDRWADQPIRVEVWIEKDALIGVLDQVCPGLDVSYFSCRGYVSASEMWRAGQRIIHRAMVGQRTVILHLGDHDPSGVQMTDDIRNRLDTFYANDAWYEAEEGLVDPEDLEDLSPEVWRIALNMDQVRQYNPPPNPAKITDSRAVDYIDRYGPESWELDALDPATLTTLIEDSVAQLRDDDLMDAALEREEAGRDQLLTIAAGF